MIKILFVSLFFFCSSLFALKEEDQIAIKQIIQNYTIAWNLSDMHEFSKAFSEDADFVNVMGMYFSGRKEIEERHVLIHQTFLKGSILNIQEIKMRELLPDQVVSVIVRWELEEKTKTILSNGHFVEMKRGVFTHVFLKKNNAWEISVTQNTVSQ